MTDTGSGADSDDPDPATVHRAVADLLREQEVGALATIGGDGAPAVAAMHVAADGARLYIHLFTASRTHANLVRDPRAACTVSHQPPGGMAQARLLRSVQITGRAAFVDDPAEIAHAVALSRDQFSWLQDSRMYDNVERAVDSGRQVFVRLDPHEALWTDNRVRMLWRRTLRFSSDARTVDVVDCYAAAPDANRR